MRNNVPSSDKPRRPLRPLDEGRLRELAIRYVGRYATTRFKLAAYLTRKLRERGWEGGQPVDLAALVAKMDDLGFVDDEAYAGAKARALTARGYGARRVAQALYVAGVGDEDRAEAEEGARAAAFDSARNFARKRRFGPFAAEAAEPDRRQKQIAAFLRAGHDVRLARRFVDSAPGCVPEAEDDA